MWWEFLACQWKPFSKAAIIRTKRRTFLQVSKGFLKFWQRWKLETPRSRNFFFQKKSLFVKNHSTTFIRLHPDTVFYIQSSVFRDHPNGKIRKWKWKRHRNKTKQTNKKSGSKTKIQERRKKRKEKERYRLGRRMRIEDWERDGGGYEGREAPFTALTAHRCFLLCRLLL